MKKTKLVNKILVKTLGINKAQGRRRLMSTLTYWIQPVLMEPPYVEYKGKSVSYLRKGIMRFLESWQPNIHGKVLDVGVGTWPFCRQLFGERCEYIATDCFEHENIDVVSDIHTLSQSFEADSFDFVLCTDVLEHVKDPAQAIGQIRTVLKPGGKLLITTPFNYPIHTAEFVRDYWRFTDDGLRTLLSDFAEVDVQPNGNPKFPYGYFTVATK